MKPRYMREGRKNFVLFFWGYHIVFSETYVTASLHYYEDLKLLSTHLNFA